MRCSSCRYLYEDEGFAGTEVTGATPPELSCMKLHWYFDFSDARTSLRVIQAVGDACADFDPVGG